MDRKDARRRKRTRRPKGVTNTAGDGPRGESRGGTTNRERPRGERGTTNGGVVPPLASMPTETSRTDFGKGFTSDLGLDIFANPEVVSNRYMTQHGQDPLRGGGMTKVMSDLAGVMPDLFFLTQGGTTGQGNHEFGIGAPSFLDFAGGFLDQMSGTNKYVDPSVIGNLFSGQGAGNSPLDAFLNDPNADPGTQIQRLLGLMSAGLQTTIPPQILQAILGVAQQSGTQYLDDLANPNRSRGGTFADALKRGTNIDEWFGV